MLYLFMKRVIAPLLRALFRPVVAGLENVPDDGPVIMASNHLSFVDSVLIPMMVPRRVVFLAKAEYFEIRGIGRILGAFLSAMGNNIPVPRTEKRAAVAALDIALDVLAEGDAFAIYPEGTRSEDGMLHRGHTGVAWLALNSGARVVPVAVKNTDKIMPVDSKFPRLRRPGVRFGPPIDFSGYRNMPPARARRAVTDELMKEIQKLSGQEYAHTYNERSTPE